MLLALLSLAAVAALAAALVATRRRGSAEPEPTAGLPPVAPAAPARRAVVVAEAVPAPRAISGVVARPRPVEPPVLVPPPSAPSAAGDALVTLDALLAELESATVRIDGADALDERSVTELEGLAERLEAAAASLAPR
jgi:hypothetical protein